VIACLVRSEDFERVLRSRSRASSAHFAVHHLADRPSASAKAAKRADPGKLSTAGATDSVVPVDDSPATTLPSVPPSGLWLGAVVPKRHAKRSVTRTLLKRQIRAAIGREEATLAAGLWVVRLRAAFDPRHFISAASDELKSAARAELRQVLASASQRVGPR